MNQFSDLNKYDSDSFFTEKIIFLNSTIFKNNE